MERFDWQFCLASDPRVEILEPESASPGWELQGVGPGWKLYRYFFWYRPALVGAVGGYWAFPVVGKSCW